MSILQLFFLVLLIGFGSTKKEESPSKDLREKAENGIRLPRSIGNFARLLLGGNVPPDHPLVKYPDPIYAPSSISNKVIASVPGMTGTAYEPNPNQHQPQPTQIPQQMMSGNAPIPAVTTFGSNSHPFATQPQYSLPSSQQSSQWQQKTTNQASDTGSQFQPTQHQTSPSNGNYQVNSINPSSNTFGLQQNNAQTQGNSYNSNQFNGGGAPGRGGAYPTNGNTFSTSGGNGIFQAPLQGYQSQQQQPQTPFPTSQAQQFYSQNPQQTFQGSPSNQSPSATAAGSSYRQPQSNQYSPTNSYNNNLRGNSYMIPSATTNNLQQYQSSPPQQQSQQQQSQQQQSQQQSPQSQQQQNFGNSFSATTNNFVQSQQQPPQQQSQQQQFQQQPQPQQFQQQQFQQSQPQQPQFQQQQPQQPQFQQQQPQQSQFQQQQPQQPQFQQQQFQQQPQQQQPQQQQPQQQQPQQQQSQQQQQFQQQPQQFQQQPTQQQQQGISQNSNNQNHNFGNFQSNSISVSNSPNVSPITAQDNQFNPNINNIPQQSQSQQNFQVSQNNLQPYSSYNNGNSYSQPQPPTASTPERNPWSSSSPPSSYAAPASPPYLSVPPTTANQPSPVYGGYSAPRTTTARPNYVQNNFPSITYDPVVPISSYNTPKTEYGPPHGGFGSPISEYGPQTKITTTYGPPTNSYSAYRSTDDSYSTLRGAAASWPTYGSRYTTIKEEEVEDGSYRPPTPVYKTKKPSSYHRKGPSRYEDSFNAPFRRSSAAVSTDALVDALREKPIPSISSIRRETKSRLENMSSSSGRTGGRESRDSNSQPNEYLENFKPLKLGRKSPTESYVEPLIDNEGLPRKDARVEPSIAVFHTSYI